MSLKQRRQEQWATIQHVENLTKTFAASFTDYYSQDQDKLEWADM